jgi:hypothetical protein
LTDLTPRYLEESRARRYEKAVPPEEDSLKSSSDTISHPTSIDQYGFGVLVEEVLRKKSDSMINLFYSRNCVFFNFQFLHNFHGKVPLHVLISDIKPPLQISQF